MNTQPQPAPVLAWHNEAALEIRRYFGKPLLDICETDPVLPYILAKHDPHAETVRLLEGVVHSVEQLHDSPKSLLFNLNLALPAIRTHLAKLKGTQ